MAKKPARIDKRIEVILLETDKHLGEKYELVKVKAIFAKNVLFPLKRAVLATTDMVNTYKTKMDNAAKVKAKKAEGLASLFDKIAEVNGVQFVMKANDRGVLYEKIDADHIVNRIKEVHDIEVESHYFKMKKKITQIGEYTIPFQYGTVDKDIHIVIKAEKNSKKDEHKDSDESEVVIE